MSHFDRVILVDDNELDNDFHEIVLRKAGYTGDILRFVSGVDLLEFLASAPAQPRTCVLLDINMPILNGFDTADRLAGMGLPDPPEVHILSSSDSLADQRRASAQPFVRGYLVKPLTVTAARRLLGA